VPTNVAHALVTIVSILKLSVAAGLINADEENEARQTIAANVSSNAEGGFFECASDRIVGIYQSVGIDPPDEAGLFPLLAVLTNDLGLSPYPKIQSALLKKVGSGEQQQRILVRIDRLNRTKLFNVELLKGVVVVTVNWNHPFVQECLENEVTRSQLGKLALAYGLASNDMYGSSDQIQAFTSYLGLTLDRALDQFLQQALTMDDV
jgi:hypothetical protein